MTDMVDNLVGRGETDFQSRDRHYRSHVSSDRIRATASSNVASYPTSVDIDQGRHGRHDLQSADINYGAAFIAVPLDNRFDIPDLMSKSDLMSTSPPTPC